MQGVLVVDAWFRGGTLLVYAATTQLPLRLVVVGSL